MIKDRGFLKYARNAPKYRPVTERLGDFFAVEQSLLDEEILEQTARCMDCGTPFCHGLGCPLANVIPELNRLVFRKRWKAALEILLTTSTFPEFTARVCPALCEEACVLGVSSDPVAIRQIELAIIEKGFERGYIVPEPPSARNGMRVAVVGSGPAGLAAANALNKKGYRVVVYEKSRYAGGILRYGIPDFKLEKWVIRRRIELMEAEGVVFETGVDVGKDISLAYLQSRNHALIVAGGASVPRDLPVPGRELKGIHFAMDFLTQQNKRLAGEFVTSGDEIIATGRKVVILGGGDTGADCLGTALRQGASAVCQIEILPAKPLAHGNTGIQLKGAGGRESTSHQEGGRRLFSVLTEEFLGDESGRVSAIRASDITWKQTKDGEYTYQKIAGSSFYLEADLVVIAMGFVGPNAPYLNGQMKTESDKRGFWSCDEKNMTAKPGIFVAGDIHEGPSLVVRAIADGKRAARGVIKYLENR